MKKKHSMGNKRVPAEWEPHEATWLAWPYDQITFGSLNQKGGRLNSERLSRVEKEFTKIIAALLDSEQVNLLLRNRTQFRDKLEHVRMFEVDYADVWVRDYLPTFVVHEKGSLGAIKWGYNAYGEKFPSLATDNHVWMALNQNLRIDTLDVGILLEPGAIEANGGGTLVTTEQCLFKRNPNLSRGEYEGVFAEHLGIRKVIWLASGLYNDHTDGHVDDVVKFVSPSKLLCAYESDPADPNYQPLKDNYDTLTKSTDAFRKPFEVIKLPLPHIVYDDGQRAPASYANFFIANKVVIVPIFHDPNDDEAMNIIQSCFPKRKVVPIDCTDIIYGGGAIHCLTKEQPLLS